MDKERSRLHEYARGPQKKMRTGKKDPIRQNRVVG
jgi:hypothetical protein